jgi:transglutaminase-like putative cysteine protease
MRRANLAEGWPTLFLLGWSVFLTFQTIAAAGWGERVELAPRLALAGLLVGLLGAKGPLRPAWSLALSLWIGFASLLAGQALAGPGRGWSERLALVSAQLWGWYRALPLTGPVHDQLVFSTALAAAAYLVGLCCAWLVFRFANGWVPLIALAAIGLLHLSYATVDSVPPFLASLVAGLLTVASLELHRRQADWRAIGVPVQAASTAWTLASAAVLLGLALVLAHQLPAGQLQAELASRYQALTGPWTETQRLVDRFVGGARGQARPGSGLSFGARLEPRGSFELGSEPLLAIRAAGPSYWRTATYDRYDGRSIQASEGPRREYPADQPLPSDPDAAGPRRTVEQTVTILSSSASAAFSPEAPARFSTPIGLEVRAVEWDLAAVRLEPPLRQGQSYTLQASLALAGRRELSEAGQSYPDWLGRYFELPASVPERVGALTRQVTAAAATPFERAAAIEAYLRGLTYETRTITPPAERDWADFVLFDSRSGYCDYFATAMVVMLRTQGVPARVASGFAPGPFDEGRQAWLLRESEAHSWVEVYFPGFGWQVFEPSAARQLPTRIETAALEGARRAGEADESGLSNDEEQRDQAGRDRADQPAGAGGAGLTPLGAGLLILGSLVALLGLLARLAAGAWERGLSGAPAASRRYTQVRRLLDWAGWSAADSATPREVAQRAAQHLPERAADLRALADAHALATYGRLATAEREPAIEAAWRRLRRPLLLAVLRRRLGLRRPAGRPELP